MSISSFAQNGINYKAVIKDNLGNVVVSSSISIQFTVLEGTTAVYRETHSPITDDNGIVIANIGEGTPNLGTFTAIDWGSDDHFLKVELDSAGGTNYVDMGTTQFMSVPYAINAANVSGLERITENGLSGYRLIGRDESNYGNIGTYAVDFSYGYEASTTKGATGNFSFATGFSTTASGNSSTATGSNTQALGNISTAMGNNSIASGDYAFVMGTDCLAIGSFSTAIGFGSTASGDASTAMGLNTEASGLGSTAIGGETTASGGNSMAAGVFTTASGNQSTAMGASTTASGVNSTAIGGYTTASGDLSTSMGYFTTAPSYIETVMGRYNTTYTLGSNGNVQWNPTDRLFVIGNGTSNANRSNALTVLKNGNHIMSGSLNINDGIASGVALSVNGVEALWYNGTYFSWGYGGTANLFADNVGIGTPTPVTELQIIGGTDASLNSNSGYMVLGQTSGNNIVIDDNEIMARNNGATSILYLQNDGGAVYVGGALAHSSDKRLKKDIADLSYGLNEILELKPKSYYWKNREQDHKSFGLIAQDVQKVIKELVLTNKESDLLSVNYTELIPVLIKAIQEQQDIINSQSNKINTLTAEAVTKDETLKVFDQRLKQIESLIKSNNQ
jgi:hypothetical protein